MVPKIDPGCTFGIISAAAVTVLEKTGHLQVEWRKPERLPVKFAQGSVASSSEMALLKLKLSNGEWLPLRQLIFKSAPVQFLIGLNSIRELQVELKYGIEQDQIIIPGIITIKKFPRTTAGLNAMPLWQGRGGDG